MDWLVIALIGIAAGWVTSRITQAHRKDHGAFSGLLLGMFGAFLGRWVYLQSTNQVSELIRGNLTTASILSSIVAAVVLTCGVQLLGEIINRH